MTLKEIEAKLRNLETTKIYLEKEIKDAITTLENLGITNINDAIKKYKENAEAINQLEKEIEDLEKEIENLEKELT